MTPEEKVEDLEAELRLVESSLGRFASENSHLRTALRKNYEARRRLEGAIRRHVQKECDCHNHTACIVALGKLVPKKPRPAYKKRHESKVRET